MLALLLGGHEAVFVLKLLLTVAFVVADAADGLADHCHVKALCVAADAGTDIGSLAGYCLVDDIGVSQERTTHNDSVEVASVDEFLCLLDVHAHTLCDGSLDSCLDLAAEVCPCAVGNFHGDEGNCRLVPACGDGEAVNITGLVQQLTDLCDIVAVAAAVHEVAAADTKRNGIVGADCLSHALKGLDHEAAAVFERAAVFVGAVVCKRREELAVQVAGVCLDLDAVEAGLLCDDRSVCLPVDELLDLLNGELLGHLKVSESAGDGGRCNSLLALNACAVCASAAMHELCKYLAAALVDGVGQLLERGNVLLVGEHCAVVGVVADLIPLHICENDKADSAECTASVELDNIIHNKAVDGVANAHG
ncbi:2 4-dienoyl-CoA reductase FadH2 [Firmicutes bacterium CAG:555]|nr:2 4-dienoyl-CoA reductase FadH2 [Firmicutes bacterium CAG:555]